MREEIQMYSRRTFNLNSWLRNFIRADLVDAYEAECLQVVDEYAGSDKEELPEIVSKLNEKLTNLSNTVLELRREWESGDVLRAFIPKNLIEEIGYDAAIERLRGEILEQMPTINFDQYESTVTDEEIGIRWIARRREPPKIESE
jgi:hypothetical protein